MRKNLIVLIICILSVTIASTASAVIITLEDHIDVLARIDEIGLGEDGLVGHWTHDFFNEGFNLTTDTVIEARLSIYLLDDNELYDGSNYDTSDANDFNNVDQLLEYAGIRNDDFDWTTGTFEVDSLTYNFYLPEGMFADGYERFYIHNMGNGYGFSDFWFITTTLYLTIDRVEAVPEPSTLLLLGTGIVGLVGFRRKFRG